MLLLTALTVFATYCVIGQSYVQKPTELLVNSVISFRELVQGMLDETGEPFNPDPEYPYWNFFPTPIDSLLDNGKVITWSAPCFVNNSATMLMSSAGSSVYVKIKSWGATGTAEKPCDDSYALAFTAMHKDITISSVHPSPVATKEVTLELPKDITDAERWDLANKGLRLFRYNAKPSQVYSNVLVTIDLFRSELTGGQYYERETEMNRDMLLKYTHQNVLDPIDPSSCQPLDPSEIHSGDFICLIGMDGMGSMMSFAMGSTTSHTTVALWIDGELNVCESTGSGVQCNPYETFLANYEVCQMIVAPLSEERRAVFNETAALEYVKSVDGLAYGFHTLLWTWIDTEYDNYPCVAPDFGTTPTSSCMTAEWAEVFMALVDRVVPEIGWLIFNTGLAKRLGVADTLRTAELYQIAAEQGYERWSQVAIIPESDEWVYNTTRNGEMAVGQDMTCCVFVCNVWKAAGVFDDDIVDEFNCAELTNWDDYVLTVLGPKYTQVRGNYTMILNDYNSKDPYAHMGDTCAGVPPDYPKDPKC